MAEHNKEDWWHDFGEIALWVLVGAWVVSLILGARLDSAIEWVFG